MDELILNNLYRKYEYKIEEDGISYNTRNFSSYSNGFVHFEKLGGRVHQFIKREVAYLFFGTGLFISGIALYLVASIHPIVDSSTHEVIYHSSFAVVLSVMGFLLILLYFIGLKGGTYIKNPNNVSTLNFPPSNIHRTRIEQFSKNIVKKRNQYLLKKYTRLIPNYLSDDQKIGTWQWLNNEKVISDEEFAERLEEINNKGNIGFS